MTNLLFNGDCIKKMASIEKESIDAIVIDPPYKYLKNAKLESNYDEGEWMNEAWRILKKTGFLVFFGRGTSFYRLAGLADSRGFDFCEEIIWDKRQRSSPTAILGRVHETIAVFRKKKARLNRVYRDKIQKIINSRDWKVLLADNKRIITFIRKLLKVETLSEFLACKKESINHMQKNRNQKHNITVRTCNLKSLDRGFEAYRNYNRGGVLTSIISCNREHYKFLHPTMKPIDLMEKLILLTTKEGDVVLDCFAGSGSTGVACQNTKRRYILIEKEEEYYNIAKKRLVENEPEPSGEKLPLVQAAFDFEEEGK